MFIGCRTIWSGSDSSRAKSSKDMDPSWEKIAKTFIFIVGEKNFIVLPLFRSHKYHKIKNYFIVEQVKKKLWANLQRIIDLFTQKIVRSGIRKTPFPDQRVKSHRIPDPDPQHSLLKFLFFVQTSHHLIFFVDMPPSGLGITRPSGVTWRRLCLCA